MLLGPGDAFLEGPDAVVEIDQGHAVGNHAGTLPMPPHEILPARACDDCWSPVGAAARGAVADLDSSRLTEPLCTFSTANAPSTNTTRAATGISNAQLVDMRNPLVPG
jgi:hypothetical protein